MYNTSEEINKRINSGIYQLIPKGPEYTAISRARVDAFNYKKNIIDSLSGDGSGNRVREVVSYRKILQREI